MIKITCQSSHQPGGPEQAGGGRKYWCVRARVTLCVIMAVHGVALPIVFIPALHSVDRQSAVVLGGSAWSKMIPRCCPSVGHCVVVCSVPWASLSPPALLPDSLGKSAHE